MLAKGAICYSETTPALCIFFAVAHYRKRTLRLMNNNITFRHIQKWTQLQFYVTTRER